MNNYWLTDECPPSLQVEMNKIIQDIQFAHHQWDACIHNRLLGKCEDETCIVQFVLQE